MVDEGTWKHRFLSTTMGIRRFAECPWHSAKPKKHSVKGLLSVILGKRHSVNFYQQTDFAECFLSDTRQRLRRVPKIHSANIFFEKSHHHPSAPAVRVRQRRSSSEEVERISGEELHGLRRRRQGRRPPLLVGPTRHGGGPDADPARSSSSSEGRGQRRPWRARAAHELEQGRGGAAAVRNEPGR